MTDSHDIKIAANRLQEALRSLEAALDPLVARVTQLEKMASVAQDFEADRANLAGRLDEAATREKEFQAHEAEFNALAEETTQELDRVIGQVKKVLDQEA